MDLTAIQRFRQANVLIVGDFMLDKYIGGDVQRISPEAPVPILKMLWESDRLGGAGNVVNNIQSLSAKARVLCCIGEDEAGGRLVSLLRDTGADVRFLQKSTELPTIKKTRIVARNQQVIRIDCDGSMAVPACFQGRVQEQLDEIFSGIDVLVISDYGKGTITYDLAQLLIGRARAGGVPVLIDPKGNDWGKYSGATLCTPNLRELSDVCNKELAQDMEDEIRAAACELCRRYALEHVLVTRSEMGMSLVSKSGEKIDFPAQKKEVIDVSGAGDTVISVMALGMAAGSGLEDCCRLANAAADIVVSKFGTATASIDELIGHVFTAGKKIVTREEAAYLARGLHEQGKRIVFTNGCFDLIHAGHIFSLEQAKALGDVLIVGVNSDRSIRGLKGEARPIISEGDRACLLKSLRMVDYVAIFDEDTPEELIQAVQPDVLVKGRDYEGAQVAGRDVVEARGGNVALIDLKPGLSTTAIIHKIQSIGC